MRPATVRPPRGRPGPASWSGSGRGQTPGGTLPRPLPAGAPVLAGISYYLNRKRWTMKRAIVAAGVAAVALIAAGCGSSAASSSGSGSSSSPAAAAPVTLTLGFLTNITHATALVGVKEGIFTKDLGSGVTLKLVPFSTGTPEATALLAGQLDAAYVGPNPAIKAWQTSGGKLIKIISGVASGGAELVVKKS